MKNSQNGNGNDEIFEPITPWIFKVAKRILYCICGFFIICFGLNKVFDDSNIVEEHHYNWKGYDKNRPIWEMSEVDYTNHEIKYAPKGDYTPSKASKDYREEHKGIRVQINGTWVNLDGIDHQDILHELNVEYEDLYEYLMD